MSPSKGASPDFVATLGAVSNRGRAPAASSSMVSSRTAQWYSVQALSISSLFSVAARYAVSVRGAVVGPGVAPEQHYGDLPGLVRTAALAQPVDGSVPDSVHRLLRDYPPEAHLSDRTRRFRSNACASRTTVAACRAQAAKDS